VIEIHERVVCPKPFSQLFPRDQLARAFDQQGEHLTRLLLQFDPLALFVNFPGAKIQLELAKTQQARQIGGAGQ
jgi:hypothetical protein